MCNDIIGEQAFEMRHGAGLSGVEEGPHHAVAGSPMNRLLPWLGEMRVSLPPELARVGLAYLERLGDVAERIVERLAEHEDGAFGRGQPLEQEQDRVFDVR